MYIYSYLVDVMLASLHQLLDGLLERSATEPVPWQVSDAALLHSYTSWIAHPGQNLLSMICLL